MTNHLLRLCVLTALLVLSGCADNSSERSPQTATRNPSTEGVQTDAAPIVKRWPGVGQPLKTEWVSGTIGSPDAAGPTTYWIDAVVTVTPQVAAQLRMASGLSPAGDPPAVDAALISALPATNWQRSDALDTTVWGNNVGNSFSPSVHLAESADVVTIRSVGGN